MATQVLNHTKYKAKSATLEIPFIIITYDDGSVIGEIWFGFINPLNFKQELKASTTLSIKEFTGNSEEEVYNLIADFLVNEISDELKIELLK